MTDEAELRQLRAELKAKEGAYAELRDCLLEANAVLVAEKARAERYATALREYQQVWEDYYRGASVSINPDSPILKARHKLFALLSPDIEEEG